MDLSQNNHVKSKYHQRKRADGCRQISAYVSDADYTFIRSQSITQQEVFKQAIDALRAKISEQSHEHQTVEDTTLISSIIKETTDFMDTYVSNLPKKKKKKKKATK